MSPLCSSTNVFLGTKAGKAAVRCGSPGCSECGRSISLRPERLVGKRPLGAQGNNSPAPAETPHAAAPLNSSLPHSPAPFALFVCVRNCPSHSPNQPTEPRSAPSVRHRMGEKCLKRSLGGQEKEGAEWQFNFTVFYLQVTLFHDFW